MQGRHCVAFFTNNVFSPEMGADETDYGPWSLGVGGVVLPKIFQSSWEPPRPLPSHSVHCSL